MLGRLGPGVPRQQGILGVGVWARRRGICWTVWGQAYRAASPLRQAVLNRPMTIYTFTSQLRRRWSIVSSDTPAWWRR
jgi:hypothetical protein